jgi:NAD-dependent DNA ligase
MSPEQDINELLRLGFMVPNPVASNGLNKEMLEKYFEKRKKEAPYEMDGLVIYQNIAGEYPVGEAPRHVVAFKTATETGVTTVTEVVWRASKDKLLKPVVHYQSINLSGADLTKASGYNARFILNNNIGPGAQILLTRSGDVIPKIISVIRPSPSGPSYPNINEHGSYKWNENEVEFVLLADNKQVITGKIKHFLDTIGIKNFGTKRVEAMVNAGINNITILLNVTPGQLAGIPGIGPTLSYQIYQDIHDKIRNIPLARVMDASGIFDKIGERRFEMILDVYPNLLDLAYNDPTIIAQYIRGVRGFNMLADEIAAKLRQFYEWLLSHPMITLEKAPVEVVGHPTTTTTTTTNKPFAGMSFVFSGKRNKDLEERVKQLGGKIGSSVTRNTTMLVIYDMSPENMRGKAEKARELGKPIMTHDQFISQYLQNI